MEDLEILKATTNPGRPNDQEEKKARAANPCLPFFL
ncbi:uncharacterized protein G2W53_019154 [Senna tora]|uniref:Uncharacterized protein n=1 Tax=Senna tora TaxID=362788 RepID=A0A834WLR4_9FABA|nr:uncharacterized protein G2W53_019154 [Senna tora]